MGVAARIARRSLTGNPGRTAFSILGVAVGIATVVGVFTLDHVTVLSRTKHLTPDFGADLEVRPRAELTDPRAELLSMEGVAGVAAFFQNEVGFRALEPSEGDDRSEPISLVGLEAGAARTLGVYYVEDGEDLDAGSAETGVLIGRKLAEDFGLAVGDRVVLSQPKKAAKKKCVEGVFAAVDPDATETGLDREDVFRVTGVLAKDGLGRRAGGRMAVVDYERGRALLSDVFLESQFWLRRDDKVDLETLESGLARSFTFERNETKAVGQMADERAFRNGVRMAGLFALLLGLFVIFHTLSMSLVQRVREVGTLHAIGATRGQIAAVFFTEALFIALVAGGLGLGGGIGLAALLLRRGITTLGMVGHSVGPIDVPWVTVGPLVALGVGMALIGSVFPILRARGAVVVGGPSIEGGSDVPERPAAHGFHVFSILVLVAIVPVVFFQVVPIVGAAESRLIGTLVGGLIVLGLLIGLPLMAPRLFGRLTSRMVQPLAGAFPLVGKLVSSTLEHSPSRVGSSIAGIALVTSAFVGLKGMTHSLVGEIEVWGDESMTNKVWVEGLPDLDLDELSETLHDVPGVLGFESRDARAMPSFLLFGMRPDELADYGPLADDPALVGALRDSQAIVLSGRLARQRGLTLGDKVLIQTSGHDVQEFEVIAVTDAYGYFRYPDERAYGIVDQEHLRRLFCVDVSKSRTISVAHDGSASRTEMMASIESALRARFPRLEEFRVLDRDEILGVMLADLRSDFVLFDVILFLTAVLAGLGVLNGQLLAALERRKEIGVLRALGTTRGQVAGAVLLESALIGGVGGVLGALVGSGLTPVLVSTLRVLSGLPLPLRSAGGSLAFALVGALALALLAGLYPIWRMNRFDDVRAVRTG